MALTGETRQEGRGAEEGGVEKAVEGMEGSECVFLLDRLVVFGIAGESPPPLSVDSSMPLWS